MGKKYSNDDKIRSSKYRKKKKRSSSSSSSSSHISLDEETKKKLKKKLKKLKKKEKRKRKEKKALKKLMKSKVKDKILCAAKEIEGPTFADVGVTLLEKSKDLTPMTKEEWEKQQNILKRVYDEETGRMRLVKGTGEIVEECVSRERHLTINKQATRGDGDLVNSQKYIMEVSDVVEGFYGVYLLKSLNPMYKGRTYIGYTVDPNRRIKQHNKGKLYGGAWKTSNRGPWEMTLTVHGFPSDVAALRFEWAWQHPKRSRRLKFIITNRKSNETSFDYCLRILFTMLSIPPWSRLPLTIRWLSADVVVDPPPNLVPPVHMPIIYGPVVSKKLKSPVKKAKNGEKNSKTDEEMEEFHTCHLCHGFLDKNESLVCLNKDCCVRWHILCLAKYFLEREPEFTGIQSRKEASPHIIPIEGCCSRCDSAMLWGDLIRRKKGCYIKLAKIDEDMLDNSL